MKNKMRNKTKNTKNEKFKCYKNKNKYSLHIYAQNNENLLNMREIPGIDILFLFFSSSFIDFFLFLFFSLFSASFFPSP